MNNNQCGSLYLLLVFAVKLNLFFIGALFPHANAQVSTTLLLTNDYLFNGVSQTLEDPALQLTVNWQSQSNYYAGGFISNVDFGDDTNIEADAYLGYYHAFNKSFAVDIGLAQYSYHGASYSDELNYAETWLKFNINDTALNFWYSWDYFGFGGGHYIVMLNHTVKVNEQLSVLFGVDKSTSLDSDSWQWGNNDTDYVHWQVMSYFSYQGIDMALGVQGTDLDKTFALPSDTSIIFSLSRSF
ncbi:TorF family putative porin [Colwelliaceae bacterium 6471]